MARQPAQKRNRGNPTTTWQASSHMLQAICNGSHNTPHGTLTWSQAVPGVTQRQWYLNGQPVTVAHLNTLFPGQNTFK